MENLNRKCIEPDCLADFYIKESDRRFYESKGYDLPKRCWSCRQKRKKSKQNKAKAAVYKK